MSAFHLIGARVVSDWIGLDWTRPIPFTHSLLPPYPTTPLTLPRTTTTHLLSTPEFTLLHASNPRGTYVANIARGAIIDQPALISALEEGLISGAALDVADPEPLPADDPLWDAPNVLITPHCSGATDVYADRAFQVLIENVRREKGGRGLVNEVDRERGY